MKVWIKVALLNSIVLIIFATLIAFAMRSVVINAVQNNSLDTVELVALTTADHIANNLLLNDRYSTEQDLQNVITLAPSIEYMFVVGLGGELFADTFENGYPPDLLNWNPLQGKRRSVRLLDTEVGYINDVAVEIFKGTEAQLHIGVQGKSIQESLDQIRTIIITLTAVVAMVSTLMSFILSRLLTQPLNNLALFATALHRGEFGKTIPPRSKDEIGKLTETFNSLSLELKTNKEKLEESYRQMCITDKISAMSRLSAGLAHELRNPITAINILLKTVKGGADFTEKDLDIVLSELSHMDKILGRFLDTTCSDDLTVREHDLNEIIKETLKLIHIQLNNQKIEVVFKAIPLPKVFVDRSIFSQALLNIYINAMEAMPDGGVLTIQTSINNQNINIDIKDNGVGIPSEIQNRIFEPFFTTKSTGTGFGLFIIENILSSHHGKLIFHSDDSNTVFTIILPLRGTV
jgi:signal transduction histidine kinase